MLQIRALSKQFGAFQALDKVDFAVRAGEIVGLLGENGAGKSTLLKIIGGEIAPTAGEIHLNDSKIQLRSPREATRNGIGIVHQHFMLVPDFTVSENIALHALNRALFDLDYWSQQIEEWADSLGWKINPRARVADLSVGEQQRVEIVKALFASGEKAKLLLLDEPTANLTPQEVQELITVLRSLRDQQFALVFVSHKLHEVMELCDRVTVLRHGRVMGERLKEQTSTSELATLMVGRGIMENEARGGASVAVGNRQFKIENLSCALLRDVSFTVHGGEIVGIAGVDGNGQRELVEVLSQLRPPEAGSFSVQENERQSAGVLGIIPADRQTTGLILDFDLAENLALHPEPRHRFKKKIGLDWQGLRNLTREFMERFDVRSPATKEKTAARRLSGGNQQKLVVARALSFQPSAVIAVDPTRGLDIGASQFVHENLRKVAEAGTPVLLISSDLDEILHLSHRIGVLYEGHLLPDETLLPADTSREHIGALMGGSKN